MSLLLYVHGTGVREPEYTHSCWAIDQQLTRYLPGWTLARCAWGEKHGVRFPDPVKSIPGYIDSRAIESSADTDRDKEEALWHLLYEDPQFELRLAGELRTGGSSSLQDDDDGFGPPSEMTAGKRLLKKLRSFAPSPPLAGVLDDHNLTTTWSEALGALLGDTGFTNLVALGSASGTRRAALGRAIVAEMTRQLEQRRDPQFDGRVRDAIVSGFVALTGGGDRSVVTSVLERFGGIAKDLAVRRFVDRRRGSLSDAATPLAGDIIYYQTRGDGIRQFIANSVGSAMSEAAAAGGSSPKLVLLAHSLGGIACVDLLASTRLPVEALITVGSQAPYLYEIDSLCKLRRGEPLPPGVPRWLNIYDRRDILSYAAQDVFAVTRADPPAPPRVLDEPVDNRLPFPQSHTAYWTNPQVWTAIRTFLNG